MDTNYLLAQARECLELVDTPGANLQTGTGLTPATAWDPG
jgi:hypothetical protein